MHYPIRQLHLSVQQISKIKARFELFSEDGCMTLPQFKKSMGLLGVGGAEQLSSRLFALITRGSFFTVEQFIDFLDKINHGNLQEKAALSFQYLSRNVQGRVGYQDIVATISELLFVWNFLTGQKISTTQSIEAVCYKLGISEHTAISFPEYLAKYDQHFSWYDFFNAAHRNDHDPMSAMRNHQNQFRIDQIEEYLKLVHTQVQLLLFQFKDEESDSYESRNLIQEFTGSRGPNPISTRELQLSGDREFNPRETLSYFSHQQLTREVRTEGGNIYELIANKLQQLGQLSDRLFSSQGRHTLPSQGRQTVPSSAREYSSHQRHSHTQQQKRSAMNITRPSQARRSIIYFGHESWNLMLNMMLGVRRSLKSHFYKFGPIVAFTEEDLNCKYYHELLYKHNDKSLKEISEIFVDYSPKVFYFIRKHYSIDNSQFLKSIGLQNLIGNLIMGNLSTLSDQTSEGKSGSFMYYTEDSKIIVKSISREEYRKLRQILNDYVEHIRSNADTFLMRIYGLYKLKNKNSGRQIYFMVIGNVFDRGVEINERYDIKGATHNRQTIPQGGTLLDHALFNKNIALKDVDLINTRRQFDIDAAQRQQIYRQIIKDAQFLKNHNIIEYSLLVGVHNLTAEDLLLHRHESQQASLFDRSIGRSRQVMGKDRKQSYFFGIIDILSEYSAKKVLENRVLGLFNDISCRDPEEYFQRFDKFIYHQIFK